MGFVFDSSNSEYLRHHSDLGLTNWPVTLSAWIYPTSTATSSADGIIQLSNPSGDLTTGAFDIVLLSSMKVRLTAYSGGNVTAISTTVLSLNTWYFIAAVFASNTSKKIYVNAVEENEVTTALAFDSDVGSVAIGSQWANGSIIANSQFDGIISFPQVHNTALTDNELKELMYMPDSVTDGLLFYPDSLSPFSVATDIKDLSGNGNDIDSGTLPDLSTNNPPVTFPQMQVI